MSAFDFGPVFLIPRPFSACEKITENLYVAANEPSLASYRIQEHVHKTTPMLVDKTVLSIRVSQVFVFMFCFFQIEMSRTDSTLKGLLYDVEYWNESIQSLRQSAPYLDSIHQLLKQSIFHQQQASYNESIKRRVQERLQPSPSPSSPQPSTSSQASRSRPTLASTKSSQSGSGSKAFQRFSTSFDFPTVASSVSADLKSLISQLAHSGITASKGEPTQAAPSKVSTSKSLYTLPENGADEDKEEKEPSPGS